MMLRRSLAIALVTAALIAPTAAQAADDPAVGYSSATVPLSIVGFDASVAAANGYEVRTNASGQYVTVKAGQPTSTGTVIPTSVLGAAVGGTLSGSVATPMGTVYGDCGSSSVFLSNPVSLKYKVDTAWAVVSPAVSYSWAVLVTGPGYAKTHTWGGGLLARSTWTGSATATVSANQRGAFYAYASGTVLLANGFQCQSLHPTDIENIF